MKFTIDIDETVITNLELFASSHQLDLNNCAEVAIMMYQLIFALSPKKHQQVQEIITEYYKNKEKPWIK